jgi:hypothetical protein
MPLIKAARIDYINYIIVYIGGVAAHMERYQFVHKLNAIHDNVVS